MADTANQVGPFAEDISQTEAAAAACPDDRNLASHRIEAVTRIAAVDQDGHRIAAGQSCLVATGLRTCCYIGCSLHPVRLQQRVAVAAAMAINPFSLGAGTDGGSQFAAGIRRQGRHRNLVLVDLQLFGTMASVQRSCNSLLSCQH